MTVSRQTPALMRAWTHWISMIENRLVQNSSIRLNHSYRIYFLSITIVLVACRSFLWIYHHQSMGQCRIRYHFSAFFHLQRQLQWFQQPQVLLLLLLYQLVLLSLFHSLRNPTAFLLAESQDDFLPNPEGYFVPANSLPSYTALLPEDTTTLSC